MKENFTIHDQHVHTCYSEDSSALIEPYIQSAIKSNCKYFIVTDHLDFDVNKTGYDWRANYIEEKKELDKHSKKYGDKITILQGIEVGYKKEQVDNINNVISNEGNFDVVNLSVHDYDGMDFFYIDSFNGKNRDDVIRLYLDLYTEAINSAITYDVVCHIDYCFKTLINLEPNASFKKYEDHLIPLLKAVILKEKALELNTKVQETINSEEHARYIFSLYYSLGGRDITISSDAHNHDRYRSSIDKYIPLMKELGFDHLCYYIQRKKYYYYL